MASTHMRTTKVQKAIERIQERRNLVVEGYEEHKRMYEELPEDKRDYQLYQAMNLWYAWYKGRIEAYDNAIEMIVKELEL